MFFVYGTSGQMFRGTMEQLRQVHGVGSLARSRRVAAIGRDGQDALVQAVPSGKDHADHAIPLGAYSQRPNGLIQREALTQVSEVMSRHAITMSEQSLVEQAWAVLNENGIEQTPVVNAAGQLVGLVSRAGLLSHSSQSSPDAHLTTWQSLMGKTIGQVMLTPVPSVGPEGSIRRVARVLLDTGLPGLPVVGELGRVVGYISRTNILRAVVNDPPLDLWG